MHVKGTAVLVMVMLASAAGIAVAQGGIRDRQRATDLRPLGGLHLGSIVLRDSALQWFAERFQLSQEQQNQMQEIADAYRNDNADVLERMKLMREELRALRDSSSHPTREMFAEVIERYDHPDLDLARAERRLGSSVLSILTPEQKRLATRGVRRNGRM